MVLNEKEIEQLWMRLLQEPPCVLHKRLYQNICASCRKVVCLECVDVPCPCYIGDGDLVED